MSWCLGEKRSRKDGLRGEVVWVGKDESIKPREKSFFSFLSFLKRKRRISGKVFFFLVSEGRKKLERAEGRMGIIHMYNLIFRMTKGLWGEPELVDFVEKRNDEISNRTSPPLFSSSFRAVRGGGRTARTVIPHI